MRVLVHLSDIHFGRVDYEVVKRLKEKIEEIGPHLVIVSGDLTQRARSHQFVEARDFLESLPHPQIVVPGNHDIPMDNIFARFFSPLEKYKKYITEDLQPFYADEEMAVIGVNTARSLTIKDGRINEEQVAGIREKMCGLDDKMLKIVVTHHPFDLPSDFNENDIVGRAAKAMPQIADCGADVFLSGHLHVSRITHTAERYKLDSGRSALVIQAGTATSTRVRGEVNSFNVIEFDAPRLAVKRMECQKPGTGFVPAESQEFTQTEKGWSPVSKN
ncbi:MAG TPA: metallophosphoesterase family protein [Pyrinomonadaceae bacterium]|jgi:3',5'-cyclic AMP phosphodiesterase CpdA